MMPHSSSILRLFAEGTSLGVSDLERHLDVSSKIIRKHLRALIEDGLVASDGAYHTKYRLVDNPEVPLHAAGDAALGGPGPESV
jgi:predicted ArsR family transcriptional regulator